MCHGLVAAGQRLARNRCPWYPRRMNVLPPPDEVDLDRRGKTEQTTPAYALVWRRDGSPGIGWNLRYLNHDGFYGVVRYLGRGPQPGGRSTGVSQHLTPADGERVAAILAELSQGEPTEPGPCFAILVRYTVTVGQGEVLFKYEPGAEAACHRARRFLELHSIIETYLGEVYSQIGPPAMDRQQDK